MVLLQRSDDGQETPLAQFDFDRGDLEEMMTGMTYQQVTAEGHVCLQPERSEIEVSFRSRETGRSHGCTIPTAEFRDLLGRFWSEP